MQNTRLRRPDEIVTGTQGYRIDVSLGSTGNPLAEPTEREIHGTAFVLLLATKQSTNSKCRRQSISPAKAQNQDNRKPRKNR
jgi:hypothetical protein